MRARTRVSSLIAVVVVAVAAACGSGNADRPPVSVSINPKTATVQIGKLQQFTVSVSGTSNDAVNWTVQESAGGTISATGLYAASRAAGTYHVVATSVADATKSDTATVTVTPAGAAVAVSVIPDVAAVQTGHTQQFTATVTGASNTSVTWTVQEAGGGAITAAGLYTAPAAAGTYHVVATSVADTTKRGSAAVSVTSTPPPVTVAISPRTTVVAPSGTQQFIATVTGTSNTAVTWSVQEGSGGSVSPTGLYTAPAATGTYHVVATSAADTSKSAAATVTVGTEGALIADDRRTEWNPGILADPTGAALGVDGLPVRTSVCATVSAGGNIQAAIDACPANQVVQLNAGTFTVSATINLKAGVVLRGAGSQGAPGGTTLVKTGGGPVLSIGTARDSTCYGGTGYALTQDGAKGSRTITVGAAAANFQAGDLALIDVVDDASVDQGDCPYFKRVDGRSASQRVEITAVNGAAGTLTIDSPLHWPFPAGSPYQAQITRAARPVIKWAGVEKVRVQGGRNTGYNGEMAGGIDISNAAYCWVKDVQTDETIGGMHVAMTGAYRCVVRDGYFHHSANYGFGADCYGIVLRCGAADNLIENNIVRYMNKPIMFNVTGGGNVVAYNYADNSWATPAAWQEVNIDCHCSFPHMELMEGNFAPHMGATTTHGNAGYLTYFRNYSTSQFASPAVWGFSGEQTGNISTLQFQNGDLGMNVVGNVLGLEGWSEVYDAFDDSGPKAIYSLGSEGDVSVTTLYRHGNYDTINGSTLWDASNPTRALPASLYLDAQPAWWPAGTPWPWVGPDLSPMVGTLPAKARSDAM